MSPSSPHPLRRVSHRNIVRTPDGTPASPGRNPRTRAPPIAAAPPATSSPSQHTTSFTTVADATSPPTSPTLRNSLPPRTLSLSPPLSRSPTSTTKHSPSLRGPHHDASPRPPSRDSNSEVGGSGSATGAIFSLTDAQLAQRYEFQEEIGFGNWGSVWRCIPRPHSEALPPPATDAASSATVVAKLCHRERTGPSQARVRALWNEYKVLRAITTGRTTSSTAESAWHPAIVRFIEFIITPSYALVLMPYYNQPMNVALPVDIYKSHFQQLISGLYWLHQHHITHNDIKTANLLVSYPSGSSVGGIPVLVDFGFAVLHDPSGGPVVSASSKRKHPPAGGGGAAREEELTRPYWTDQTWGTPEYLAPERARGDLHDERRSDIWSLGVTFFEIATGRTPFESESEQFLTPSALKVYYERTLRDSWVGTWDFCVELETLLRGMLAVKPENRIGLPRALLSPFFDGPEAREEPQDAAHFFLGDEGDTTVDVEIREAMLARPPQRHAAAAPKTAVFDTDPDHADPSTPRSPLPSQRVSPFLRDDSVREQVPHVARRREEVDVFGTIPTVRASTPMTPTVSPASPRRHEQDSAAAHSARLESARARAHPYAPRSSSPLKRSHLLEAVQSEPRSGQGSLTDEEVALAHEHDAAETEISFEASRSAQSAHHFVATPPRWTELPRREHSRDDTDARRRVRNIDSDSASDSSSSDDAVHGNISPHRPANTSTPKEERTIRATEASKERAHPIAIPTPPPTFKPFSPSTWPRRRAQRTTREELSPADPSPTASRSRPLGADSISSSGSSVHSSSPDHGGLPSHGHSEELPTPMLGTPFEQMLEGFALGGDEEDEARRSISPSVRAFERIASRPQTAGTSSSIVDVSTYPQPATSTPPTSAAMIREKQDSRGKIGSTRRSTEQVSRTFGTGTATRQQRPDTADSQKRPPSSWSYGTTLEPQGVEEDDMARLGDRSFDSASSLVDELELERVEAWSPAARSYDTEARDSLGDSPAPQPRLALRTTVQTRRDSSTEVGPRRFRDEQSYGRPSADISPSSAMRQSPALSAFRDFTPSDTYLHQASTYPSNPWARSTSKFQRNAVQHARSTSYSHHAHARGSTPNTFGEDLTQRGSSETDPHLSHDRLHLSGANGDAAVERHEQLQQQERLKACSVPSDVPPDGPSPEIGDRTDGPPRWKVGQQAGLRIEIGEEPAGRDGGRTGANVADWQAAVSHRPGSEMTFASSSSVHSSSMSTMSVVEIEQRLRQMADLASSLARAVEETRATLTHTHATHRNSHARNYSAGTSVEEEGAGEAKTPRESDERGTETASMQTPRAPAQGASLGTDNDPMQRDLRYPPLSGTARYRKDQRPFSALTVDALAGARALTPSSTRRKPSVASSHAGMRSSNEFARLRADTMTSATSRSTSAREETPALARGKAKKGFADRVAASISPSAWGWNRPKTAVPSRLEPDTPRTRRNEEGSRTVARTKAALPSADTPQQPIQRRPSRLQRVGSVLSIRRNRSALSLEGGALLLQTSSGSTSQQAHGAKRQLSYSPNPSARDAALLRRRAGADEAVHRHASNPSVHSALPDVRSRASQQTHRHAGAPDASLPAPLRAQTAAASRGGRTAVGAREEPATPKGGALWRLLRGVGRRSDVQRTV